jgi:ribose transport system ATP-binding protein
MQPATDGLFFDRIVKSFGGTQALKGVSLKVGRGEIVALLGENGAGKSTLIKVLGGIHRPDEGGVSIDGTPLMRMRRARRAARRSPSSIRTSA